jgi:enoyl-CoA hydratase/carnithine racemase
MTEHVLVEKSAQLLVLTLNRPEKKNALTRDMYATLAAQIDNANGDPNVRCLLLQAHGDMFTAGNDLADFAAVNSGAAPHMPEVNPFLLALSGARKPLVAAVNGRAVGIGLTMLLHCDMVFVSEDALLTAPFVNLALVPEAASSMLLPLRLGHVRAFETFVLGEPINAQKAVEWGIANRAVPLAELHKVARAAALAIASRAPSSVSATKRLLRDETALRERMSTELEYFVRQLKSPEFKEAFTAFAERRAADFSKFK